MWDTLVEGDKNNTPKGRRGSWHVTLVIDPFNLSVLHVTDRYPTPYLISFVCFQGPLILMLI